MPSHQGDEAGPLPPPGREAWEKVGLTVVEELHGGHQSRVMLVRRDGELLVVKLTDSRAVDLRAFAARTDLVNDLTAIDAQTVGPVEIGSSLVNHLGGWLAVGYPHVTGRHPDRDDRDAVERLGRTLAVLHRSLRRLSARPLPLVAALRASTTLVDAPPGPIQLLHGDYSPANVLLEGERTRVIDFDDCGYGPVEFEVGNTLYMVLFDATMDDDARSYEPFRQWFCEAYNAESASVLSDANLDRSIELRRGALRHWLDHPAEAPIGIRSASATWRRRLRTFADSA